MLFLQSLTFYFVAAASADKGCASQCRRERRTGIPMKMTKLSPTRRKRLQEMKILRLLVRSVYGHFFTDTLVSWFCRISIRNLLTGLLWWGSSCRRIERCLWRNSKGRCMWTLGSSITKGAMIYQERKVQFLTFFTWILSASDYSSILSSVEVFQLISSYLWQAFHFR